MRTATLYDDLLSERFALTSERRLAPTRGGAMTRQLQRQGV
jgi:hypothetical protein